MSNNTKGRLKANALVEEPENWMLPPAQRLRLAVRAAIEAYERTGRMLDAALAYAAHGLPVFPLNIRTKKPIPRRDKDPTGKLPRGIPGTGGLYKATCDPIQITAWWRKHPRALIGMPTGERTGFWVLDIDTGEDHADGVAAWDQIVADNTTMRRRTDKYSGSSNWQIINGLNTRQHRSATGGPHLFFEFDPDLLNGCSSGGLPDGISVKGQGGYVVMPPSRRKRRDYTVFADIDPIKQPRWLTDRILQGRERSSGEYTGDVTGDYDEVADAVTWIPNDDENWDEWNSMGLRIFAATAGEGFEIFNAWSAKSSKHDEDETYASWERITGCPPTRTGANKIFAMAREHGWVQKLKVVDSPVSPKPETTPAEGREQIKREVVKFLEFVALTPEQMQAPWAWAYLYQRDEDWPLVHAISGPTGISKTQITIEELARWMRATGARPIIYAMPHHNLSPEIIKQFTKHGLNARIFYGRNQLDRDRKPDRMCLNPKAVEMALLARADVSKTCCKDGKRQCVFYDACGYVRQQQDAEAVDVWIVASDMLFLGHKVFKNAVAIIVDEAFWQKGLRGLEGNKCVVPLASLEPKEEPEFGTRDYWRERLHHSLVQVEDDGPIAARYLEVLTPRDCTAAIIAEWDEMPKFPLKPGDKPTTHGLHRIIDQRRLARNLITIWQEVRSLLCDHDIEQSISGRLRLQQRNGLREVRWRGVASISKTMWRPTLLLDATLPDKSILQVYHPQVKVCDPITVPMPSSVRIKQVLRAPTSSNKLDNPKHQNELRRYILQRWFETGCGETLVITQKEFRLWLDQTGLPPSIHVEHYNAITGLDSYSNVRLEILIGRTAPGPAAIETITGALTGRQPEPCQPNVKGFRWYETPQGWIRLRDGTARETVINVHIDPVADAARWLIEEGEVIQGKGRARGLNRTPDCPLDIDLLVDMALPCLVDVVESWKAPSLLIRTAADDGVVPKSPADMAKGWPLIWPNEKAADRCLRDGVPQLPGFTAVTYQPKGAGVKPRTGWFDLARIPDPEAWMAERLRGRGQNP